MSSMNANLTTNTTPEFSADVNILSNEIEINEINISPKNIDIKSEIYFAERGPRGYSAYELAISNGFEGSIEEWFETLKGADGKPFTYDDFTPEQLASLVEAIPEQYINQLI